MVEGWKTVTIGDCVDILSGGTPSTNEPEYWDGSVLWCTPSDITKNHKRYLNSTERKISESGVENSSATLFPAGTIMLCSRATIGEMAIAGNEMCTNQGFKNLVVKHGTDNTFLYYALHLKKKEMVSKAYGSTFLELSKKALESILLEVPELIDEQRTIADALSDIDDLIDILEKEIEKKRNIKIGTIQNLLSGKHRLSGFDKRWNQDLLKDVTVKIGVGLATSVTKYYRSNGTVIFRNLNIKENYLDDSDILFLDEDFAAANPGKIIHTGDVITVHTGYVGMSCVVPNKYDGALTFTTLITTTKKDLLLPEYLSYHLNSIFGKNEIENLQAGCGRNNLNVGDFKQYKISYPSDLDEQKQIVEILSSIDAELRCLEDKLRKTQQVKQGMMNDLLTGKIRLV